MNAVLAPCSALPVGEGLGERVGLAKSEPLLKLLGLLLDYPHDLLFEHAADLRAAIDEVELPAAARARLAGFVERLLALEPMAAQERWLALFDRGRSMSLLLFEHIHGESRDRGQAMVDLVETYRRAGFALATAELPDYLPVVLEFLSLQPANERSDWLHHTGHIIELLAARAGERDSDYAVLLELLVELAQGRVDLAPMRRRVASEPRDDTDEAIDRVWEEEAVRFGPEAPAEDCKPPSRFTAHSPAPTGRGDAEGLGSCATPARAEPGASAGQTPPPRPPSSAPTLTPGPASVGRAETARPSSEVPR